MNYSLILLAAGKSERFNSNINKVFYKINNKMLIEYSLDVFLSDDECKEIIIVYNSEDVEKIAYLKNKYQTNIIIYVEGGPYRSKSVENGLKKALNEYVLIHDGARPLVSMEVINNVKEKLGEYDAVSTSCKCTDTIKEENNKSYQTLDRSKLYQIQTPQGVKRSLLLKALESCESYYDDLQAIEKINGKCLLVSGDKKNIKVTTKDDIELVSYYLNSQKPQFKIGFSSDIHAFCDNKELVLGCTHIDYERGLLAHSDGDCLVHAICEAIIGALGLGDLGKHFPDKDPKYKDISSNYFLKEVKKLLDDHNYEIVNIDSLVMLEKPMLAKYINQMKENIAFYLQISPSIINIKATRGEGLGFIGKGEGIEARASVLIKLKN